MADASSVGSTVWNKAVKSSQSQDGIETGNVDATYVHLSTGDGRYWIGVVRTDMPGQTGEYVFREFVGGQD